MKKFIEEFKKFALKGNVMDLAIGVIIGAAFQNIVSALTNDFITPLIAAITGKTDENGGVVIGGQFTINGATFNYGDFISSIINFLIMAFVVFVIVKSINTASAKLAALEKKSEEAKTTKICPMCRSEISIEACRCPQCTSVLDETEMQKRSVQ